MKKTIWITGGSTGIGKALAIRFANEGWNVAISARRENLLKELSDRYENISPFPLDVTEVKKNCCFQKLDLQSSLNVAISGRRENFLKVQFEHLHSRDPKKSYPKDINVEQIENVFKTLKLFIQKY